MSPEWTLKHRFDIHAFYTILVQVSLGARGTCAPEGITPSILLDHRICNAMVCIHDLVIFNHRVSFLGRLTIINEPCLKRFLITEIERANYELIIVP